MIFGMSGAPVPAGFPLADVINGDERSMVPPCLVAAIAWRETLSVMTIAAATSCVSSDGGRGIMQLTASYPDPGWNDPLTNIDYAVDYFLAPAISYWHGLEGEIGDRLVKLVAATYNEGLSAAIKYHAEGNVDLGTTNDYAEAVLGFYTTLTKGSLP